MREARMICTYPGPGGAGRSRANVCVFCAWMCLGTDDRQILRYILNFGLFPDFLLGSPLAESAHPRVPQDRVESSCTCNAREQE